MGCTIVFASQTHHHHHHLLAPAAAPLKEGVLVA
jgi:hypothetical protein